MSDAEPVAQLRGLTWDHPRGHDPLVACSAVWRDRTGVAIDWDRQSCDAFQTVPVEALAPHYDLIVIDHAQIGRIARTGCLRDLNRPERTGALNRLAREAVGESFNAYRLEGAQWGLPIDAAAQVQAWRPDRLAAPPANWAEVEALARTGQVLLPMRPPHGLLAFYTLCANLGQPCGATGIGELQDASFGASVIERLRALLRQIDPVCYTLDPIAVFERLAAADAAQSCAPLIDGCAPYARDGFRAHRLAFGDLPPAGAHGAVGATLGGAGIAVSAAGAAPEAAEAFAFWLASAPVQGRTYAGAGGQPGNAAAWQDPAANAATHDFYRNTFATLDAAWVRPRHDGGWAFQHAAARRLNEGLQQQEAAEPIMADLNRLFTASFD